MHLGKLPPSPPSLFVLVFVLLFELSGGVIATAALAGQSVFVQSPRAPAHAAKGGGG